MTVANRVRLLDTVPAGELLIHEIYRSVQGESTFAGLPCVFVRTTVCDLRCGWCFVPDTPVLMSDWSWRPIGTLAPGDEVIAVAPSSVPESHRKVTVATVLSKHTRAAATSVVNGSVRCTPDHKFWLTGKDPAGRSVAHNGWREVDRCVGMRTHFLADPRPSDGSEYERGWLAGMADGDGCFWTLKSRRGYRRFRLALRDAALLDRFAVFAARAGYPVRAGVHSHVGFTGADKLACLWLTTDPLCRSFEAWLTADVDSESWRFGYLGGILDAEGSLSQRLLRIAQHRDKNPQTWDRIRRVLDGLGIQYTVEPKGFYIHRSHGGLWRALVNSRPAKRSFLRAALKSGPRNSRVIQRVEPTGCVEPVVTLTTTVGSYIAAGYVVKNCDSPHAFTQGERMTRRQVLDRTLALDCPLVEITGGEPLLQPAVLPLMADLCDAGKTVLIETSGAHDVSAIDPRVRIIMDLKCPDSGEADRNRWANLDVLKPTDEVKFVIASRPDWDWAVDTIRTRRLDERFTCLVSAAFGHVTTLDLANWLLASGLNVRMQLQMHKYIWEPAARGV
jgi:7-carboxy-7-deazaguanine synthase